MTVFLGNFRVKFYIRSSNTLSIMGYFVVILLKLSLRIQIMQRSLNI